MKHIFRVCDNNGTVLRTINGIKSVKYHVQGGERNVLKFGNAFASSLEVEYYTLSQPDLSVGTVIRYVQHFDESLVDFETSDPKDMVINYFWVDSFQKGAKTCKFIAYDVVTKLSVDYSARLLAIKSNFPMTVNDLVNDIKTYLGFSTIQMFMSGDLHDAVLQYFYVDGITAREILGQIAELNGGNLFGLTTLSNGTLAYNILSKSFTAVNVYNITNSAFTSDYIVAPTDQEEYYVSGVLKTPVFYKQGGLEVGENDISPIDKIVIKKADGTELAYYPLSSPETNVLEIRNNIIAQNIISINSPFPHTNLANNLYQAAQSVSTRPIVTAKLFPFRFPFVCYAIIYFVDIDDTIKQFPIMNLEWTDEAVVIESFGSAIVSRDEESYSSTQDQTNTTISTVNRLEEAVSDIEDMFPVPITQGGTGGTDRATANDNLQSFFLGVGTEIPANSDLNDYKTPGTYYVINSSTAATIANSPTTGSGYKLIVMRKASTNTIHQIVYLGGNPTKPTSFERSIGSNNTWTQWYQNIGVLSVNGVISGLDISLGGTGATDAATAVANLGLATLQAERKVINNGSSAEFSVPNSSRGLIISSGSNNATKDMFLYNVTSGGAVSYVKMGTSTGITITTATNKITIANSGGSQTVVCKISF